MTGEAYTALGSVLVALIGLVGGFFTYRRSNRAVARGQSTEAQQISPGAQQQLDGLLVTVNHLSGMVNQTQTEIADLKVARAEDQRVMSACARYVSRLLLYIRLHLPERDDVPDPPEELRGLIQPQNPRD